MKRFITLLFIFAATTFLFAQESATQEEPAQKTAAEEVVPHDGDIVGLWKTIDDETGDPKSYVRIYEKDGFYFGVIDSLIRKPDEDPDPVCDKCDKDDPRYNQRVLGMTILNDMEYDDGEYEEGTILDPKKGKVYDCKLWVENGNLQVRGYILFFYRTQEWFRVK